MKKFIALFLAFVMVFAVSVNVFAVTGAETSTPMATIRIDGYEKSGNVNPGWYYYNPSDGAIRLLRRVNLQKEKGIS